MTGRFLAPKPSALAPQEGAPPSTRNCGEPLAACPIPAPPGWRGFPQQALQNVFRVLETDHPGSPSPTHPHHPTTPAQMSAFPSDCCQEITGSCSGYKPLPSGLAACTLPSPSHPFSTPCPPPACNPEQPLMAQRYFSGAPKENVHLRPSEISSLPKRIPQVCTQAFGAPDWTARLGAEAVTQLLACPGHSMEVFWMKECQKPKRIRDRER